MKKLFESGNSGRPQGALNKVTAEMGTMIDSLLKNNEETLKNDFLKLSPYQRWRITVELLGFRLPKLRSVEVEADIFNISEDRATVIMKELKQTYVLEYFKNLRDGKIRTE